MTKIKWSKGPEEWYCSYGKCCNCNTEFMCSKAHYCPGCGEKIEEEERGLQKSCSNKDSQKVRIKNECSRNHKYHTSTRC